MSIGFIILVLIVLALVLAALRYIPMQPPMSWIVPCLVILVAVVALLGGHGLSLRI